MTEDSLLLLFISGQLWKKFHAKQSPDTTCEWFVLAVKRKVGEKRRKEKDCN